MIQRTRMVLSVFSVVYWDAVPRFTIFEGGGSLGGEVPGAE